MPARTHSRSHPQTSSDRIEIQLPWWAVALPAVAFAALLLLMAGPGQAHAAADDPSVGRILEHIQLTLSR
ncbi:hypothetical protein [Streptomyces sp. AK02-01A]|uniref:hypothetical protein n=1 Tax=Streptomyces sp. AK02-01A TaxID=3028648 RepID=UPI0029A25D79|nr:hypothetical protein [Streptomyces sp. AK02-01A]MDX3851458.1 hypothetical protein [Streptomyces sp. AK02-01A]